MFVWVTFMALFIKAMAMYVSDVDARSFSFCWLLHPYSMFVLILVVYVHEQQGNNHTIPGYQCR